MKNLGFIGSIVLVTAVTAAFLKFQNYADENLEIVNHSNERLTWGLGHAGMQINRDARRIAELEARLTALTNSTSTRK